jgi:adenylate cyclase
MAPAEPAGVVGTIVFTDLVGFTEFTALRGDAEALDLLATQERVVASALPPDSRVVKELGDGLLLWFPLPRPALEATLTVLTTFEDEGGGLGVRAGMHHGHALLRGDDLVGHDVNLASRIADLAGPGEVLLSDSARLAMGPPPDGVGFEELGPVVMKGIPEPVRLWRACDGRP